MTSVTIPSLAYVATQVCYFLGCMTFSDRQSIIISGSIRFDLVTGVLQDRHNNRFRKVLQQHRRISRGSRRECRSTRPSCLVEPASPYTNHTLRNIAHYNNSQIFPGQISAKRPISKDSVLAKLKEKRAALKLRSSNHGN